MNKKTITKEHRVLDDTDLNNINNTFKDIKHDMNNNFNRIDNTFKSIEKTMNSIEKSVDEKHKTLVLLISAIGIGLTALKVFF